MDNPELLKRIMQKLEITDEAFSNAIAEIMNEEINKDLDNIVESHNYLPESPQEMNEAFRFWKQNIA